MRRLLLAFALIGVPQAALAQCVTVVAAGTVSGATWIAARSPYCVQGDLLINDLTIEAGVRVEMAGRFEIEVAGILTAVGAAAAPILFTATADNTQGWEGLFFNESVPGSEIAHVIVEKAISSGIEIRLTDLTMRDCVIRNNSRPGGQVGGGGGISTDARLTLIRCTVHDNRVVHGGGPGAGLRAVGGGIYSTNDLRVEDSVVRGNAATASSGSLGSRATAHGGGIFAAGSLIVLRSIIDMNTAAASASGTRDPRGGGIYAASDATIVNTFVHRNASAGLVNPVGGAVYLASTARLIHVTIADNTGHGLTAAAAGVEVVNSIVWRNAPLQISGTPSVAFSDVDGGFPGIGVLAVNPLFLVRDPTLPGYNVRLDRASPLVDQGTPGAAGLPTDDIDGHHRPQGGGFDMGADEVTQFSDHPVVAGVTIVRSVHIQELRDRIGALRAVRTLPPPAWTDITLLPASTVVRAIHVTELRDALTAVYLSDGVALPGYTHPTLAAGIPITAVDINELRAAVVRVE